MRARPILPGTRVKITRGCLEQRNFLGTGNSPDEMRKFYGYTLGRALQRTGVDFHAGIQMDNHHHVDVTDVHGNRPAFKGSLHGNLARGLNAKRGRFDRFWAGGGSCDTCQPTDEESFEDMAYSEANPVEAGLVKWPWQWPGFTSYGWRFGETRRFPRPSWYFDPNNPENPPEVQITRVRPNIFPELSDDELFDRLMKRVHERVIEKHEQMRRDGRRFMGEKKLAKQSWRHAPSRKRDQFTLVPKVVASSKWKRIAEIQRNRAWEREYAVARGDHSKGKPAIFPAGTYLLRVHYGVAVAHGPPH